MKPTIQAPANGASQAAAPAMRAARVIASGGVDILVDFDGVATVAERAVSCPVAPLAGDEVLVWVGPDLCHVLAVMRRAEPAPAARSSPDSDAEPAAAVEDGQLWPSPAAGGPGSLPYQPHFDSGPGSDSDGEAAIRPYTRFDVPLKPDAFGSGTYLRMGAYVEKEESMMMPALSYSKSTATNTTSTAPTPTSATDIISAFLAGDPLTADEITTRVGAAEQANAAKEKDATNADGSTKQGYLKRGDKFVKNKAGQMELLSISTDAKTWTSSGDGFLGKSDSDLNLKIGGAALIDIVKGQTTRVSKGDINFTAPEGLFSVSAKSGISITAGTSAAPANISLLAYGYVKNEAKGPLSEWFYSTSEKKTYGFAKEWFYGEKYSEFHGTSTSKFYGDEDKTFHGTATSYFMGTQTNTNLAARINMTLAATLTLALGTEFRLNAALDLKVNLAIDINIIVGFGIKMVFPIDIKLVLGQDFKYVTGLDHKNVGIDSKNYLVELKNITLKAHNAKLELENKDLAVEKQHRIRNGFWMTS